MRSKVVSHLPRAVMTAALWLGLAGPSSAGDLIVFGCTASPTEDWGRGYGAALSSTWFEVISFEGEAARVSGDELGGLADVGMTSFTASALVAPPVGRLVPYGGIGLGFFRQTDDVSADTGRLRAFILGAKLHLGILVLKGDYRRLDLSGEPLLPIETRLAVGAGISF